MAASKSRKLPAFISADFFALRTPLLPFDELLAWSDGLEAPAALHDAERLDPALAADRSRLRSRLHAAMVRAEVREALFVASPDLEASFGLWEREPESERGRGIEQALVRYFLRMAGRATPFGLCAGCSVGTIGAATKITLASRAEWRRHTRLDMDYLAALTGLLAADPGLRPIFTYRPNSSLYRAAGRMRYAESKMEGKERSYHLVAVEVSDLLEATLTRARDGATCADLAAALVDKEITSAEAEEYVAGLIESQILMPDIALAVTGPEPIHALTAQFSPHPALATATRALEQIHATLESLDAAGLGHPPERYRAVAAVLADLPAKVEISRLVQVEMVKPAATLTLGGQVLAELNRGVELLHRLARPLPPASDELARFREAFATRYEGRLVPLVEALDGETGLGFPVARGGETSPLLKGLTFPRDKDGTARWDARENLLLRKLAEALANSSSEILLGSKDLDEMAAKESPALPDSFAVMATVAAASEAALVTGDFRVLLGEVRGPSGAALLGRFCHADPELHRQVERYLRAEEALHPEAVFAEIVHLPEGRLGNILARPVLRAHEIPYLGHSGATPEQQLPITDLRLAVRDGRLALFSARLDREVIPRLTSAHNYAWNSLPTYRFLCALQMQGTASLGWDWGILQRAPFLPRVSAGKVVLARAQWNATKDELHSLGVKHGAERFRALQVWRTARRLPRYVALTDFDNHLPLDLDNVLCVETFVDRVKGRDEATLVEVFPAPDLLIACGPEGRYVHEFVVPFIRTAPASAEPGNAIHPHVPGTARRGSARSPAPRTFPPGSEWLYAKLYTGTATADEVLREVIHPLVAEVLGAGAANRWFFIRYADPEHHLRVRFHGDPERLRGEVLPAVERAVHPLLHRGQLWRVQFDTYEREVERYGGDEGTLLAEQLFQIDSEAVLEILDLVESGDAGLDERWRLALRGMDALLTDLGLDLPGKFAVLDSVRAAFAREFRADTKLKAQLSERYRKERQSLEALLSSASDADHALAPGFEILRHRSTKLAPIIAELKACEAAGRLAIPIAELAPSYLHMHANRLLRSGQRAHEMVLYDFLTRQYDTALARAREQ